jgi:hypothetical protein
MNFKLRNKVSAEKIGFLRQLFLMLLFTVSVVGCKQKSELNDVNGNVTVKIPVASQAGDSSQYELMAVTLKGLSNLKQVSGYFAQFFFSPGLNQNDLTGDSPQARFVKTNGDVYVPADSISQQMATLYYHIQNLTEFSQQIGIGDVNQGPMKIGIETRIGNSEALANNNAFYDGKSDSMLFVPYISSQLPIAVNAGIIAHEYFHSLFYKTVLMRSENKKEISSTKKMISIYNETYLRGINEGLADFWGWLYTNDEDFIHWSLSAYSANRKLTLTEKSLGQLESSERILSKVQGAIQSGPEPSVYLSDYIYKIGTPNARFLKQMTVMLTESGLKTSEAKAKMAQVVVSFIRQLSSKAQALAENEILAGELLFDFVASADSKLKLSKEQCQFVLNYIQKVELRTSDSCEKQDDESYLIKTEKAAKTEAIQ